MLWLCLFGLRNKIKTPRAHGTVGDEKVQRGEKDKPPLSLLLNCVLVIPAMQQWTGNNDQQTEE